MAGSINLSYVIDASFALSFLFPDEEVSQVEEIFNTYEAGKISLIASPMLPFEVFNGLQSAIYTKRVLPEKVRQLGQKFMELYIKLEYVDFLEVSKLAIQNHLTFYDASYVWIAQEKGFPLLTLDKRLQNYQL